MNFLLISHYEYITFTSEQFNVSLQVGLHLFYLTLWALKLITFLFSRFYFEQKVEVWDLESFIKLFLCGFNINQSYSLDNLRKFS
jgi:hypothetical protein